MSLNKILSGVVWASCKEPFGPVPHGPIETIADGTSPLNSCWTTAPLRLWRSSKNGFYLNCWSRLIK